MEFLRKVSPSIDWKTGTITCSINNKKYNLPTCNINALNDDNSFAGLPITDLDGYLEPSADVAHD